MITEQASDDKVEAFLKHLADHGVKISGCNVGGADIRTVEGVELTERRLRFAARWFGVRSVCFRRGSAGRCRRTPDDR